MDGFPFSSLNSEMKKQKSMKEEQSNSSFDARCYATGLWVISFLKSLYLKRYWPFWCSLQLRTPQWKFLLLSQLIPNDNSRRNRVSNQFNLNVSFQTPNRDVGLWTHTRSHCFKQYPGRWQHPERRTWRDAPVLANIMQIRLLCSKTPGWPIFILSNFHTFPASLHALWMSLHDLFQLFQRPPTRTSQVDLLPTRTSLVLHSSQSCFFFFAVLRSTSLDLLLSKHTARPTQHP